MNSILSFCAAPLLIIQLIMIGTSTENPSKKDDFASEEISHSDKSIRHSEKSYAVVKLNTEKLKSDSVPTRLLTSTYPYRRQKNIKSKKRLSPALKNYGNIE